MLTTLSIQPSPRSGKTADAIPASSQGGTGRSRGEPSSNAASAFRDFLYSHQLSVNAAEAGNPKGQPPATLPIQRGTANVSALPLAADFAFQRGESIAPAPLATGFVLPMQHTYQGTPVVAAQHQATAADTNVQRTPQVSASSLNAYFDPGEVVGAIAPRTTGEGNNAVTFASNVYRVPSWGMQDFVTSEGIRHRFDVEVVFREAGEATWLGSPADAIHPEVATFVLDSLRAEIEAAGIPAGALESARVYRAHGGPSVRPWYLDQMELVRPDGEKFQTSMNTFMRDPQYSMKVLKDFLTAGIPT